MAAAVIKIPEINGDGKVEICLGASVRVLKRDMTPRRRGENELGFARRELRGAAERAYGSRQICPEGVRRESISGSVAGNLAIETVQRMRSAADQDQLRESTVYARPGSFE